MHHTTTIPERPQSMLNETIGAAFRSSAMPIVNDRVHLVPYCDQLFEDHLRLRMALYPAITKFMTATGGRHGFLQDRVTESGSPSSSAPPSPPRCYASLEGASARFEHLACGHKRQIVARLRLLLRRFVHSWRKAITHALVSKLLAQIKT